jgi:hypothetical protein
MIYRGGYVRVPVSVNQFCKTVVVTTSVNKK